MGEINNVSTVREEKSELEHKGRKPLQLVRKLVALFSAEGTIVVDPFLGSGTTLIACEQLGRRCWGAEIEPEFCEHIIERWQKLSGKKARKREDGDNDLSAG